MIELEGKLVHDFESLVESFAADFSVPLPAGNWKLVCDGFAVHPAGTANYPGNKTATINVPYGAAVILMDGN